jgi:hypothetical protein
VLEELAARAAAVGPERISRARGRHSAQREHRSWRDQCDWKTRMGIRLAGQAMLTNPPGFRGFRINAVRRKGLPTGCSLICVMINSADIIVPSVGPLFSCNMGSDYARRQGSASHLALVLRHAQGAGAARVRGQRGAGML